MQPAPMMGDPLKKTNLALLYKWSGSEKDCPDDLVVNASNRPLIIAAQAFIPQDMAKILPGDRRQGDYYVYAMTVPGGQGLQRLKNVPLARRVELEKIRRLRTGDAYPEWVREAWKALSPDDRKKFEEQYGVLEKQ